MQNKDSKWIVYKFGGVSIQSAEAVKNVCKIIAANKNSNLLVVFSAMGKMTNAFEKLVEHYYHKQTNELSKLIDEIYKYHLNIINNLFEKPQKAIDSINDIFDELRSELDKPFSQDFDYEYDRIVSFGELISGKIISLYLTEAGIQNRWIDIRKNIITDSTFRNAQIQWKTTIENISNNIKPDGNIKITQGFIASSVSGETTTLGREGSDFSAAVLAYSLSAEKMIIWKDVPGVMNADPRIFSDAEKISELNYKETVELAYYGAQVIHPKTIKPLQNKNIPLFVKSFSAPDDRGTIIDNRKNLKISKPIIIIKNSQTIISVMPKDFSFINENNISLIFKVLSHLKIKVNLMENSAVSFSLVVDSSDKTKELINKLSDNFNVKYNENLTLYTFRHYNKEFINNLLTDKNIYIEQKTRHTARYVVK